MDSLGLIDSLSIQSVRVDFNRECTLTIQLNFSLITNPLTNYDLQVTIQYFIKKMVQVQLPKKILLNGCKNC